MRTKKFIYALCGLVAATLASGCSSKEFDEPAEPTPEVYSYTLNLDLDFKGTPDENDALSRAAMESIPDGAQIFMSFHLGEQVDAETFTSHEPALAKYNAEKDEWTLYTKTELQANTFGAVTAYYFGSDVFVEGTTFEEISIPATAPVFSAVTQYTMLGPNSVNMQATLKPEGVRIRFRYTSSLYNPMSVSQFICASTWNGAADEEMQYQTVPEITHSQWDNSAGDGYYYTPYYTVYYAPWNINESFFRVYDDSFPTSTRVRLFTISDDIYIGETYTVDLTSSPYRMGSYNSWSGFDTIINYADQTTPGSFIRKYLSNSLSSTVGVHIELNFTVRGYAPEDAGYSNKFGLEFTSYDSRNVGNYDQQKTEVFTFTNRFEPSYEGYVSFDYFNPELGTNYTNYYFPALIADGVDVTFSNIKITTF